MKRTLNLLGAVSLTVLLIPSAYADDDGPRGPANLRDIEVNSEWDARILEEGGNEANTNGVREPMLSTILGEDLRIPYTRQVGDDGSQLNVLEQQIWQAGNPLDPPLSATGHPIDTLIHVRDPHRDLHFATGKLSLAAQQDNVAVMAEAAEEMLDVLLGRTEGRIYDGFPLLNVNRWKSDEVGPEHFTPDSVPGEYKMKEIQPVFDDEGNWLSEPCWNDPAATCHVWEIDVHHLWYDQQFDSDTFLIKIPYQAEVDGETVIVNWNDTLRINWYIYSLVEEDLAPTQVMRDALVDFDGTLGDDRGGSVRFPFKGEDTVWVRINPGTVHCLTVQHTALRFIRGVYTWGWNVHPPRIQFLQPIFEVVNKHTGEIEWDWQGESFAYRNREDLTIDNVADEAPEKKLYTIAKAVLDGATPDTVYNMLENPDVAPGFGDWRDWHNMMSDQRQLPPEARAILEAEGKTIEDYDFVTVYMNNEMYGVGTQGHTIRPWSQNEMMTAKLINLDNHTHYFRNVGFGAPLNNDLGTSADDGIFSFEIMNFKPLYGAPKVAEMQWRAGWGFRPHYSVIQQGDVFPRPSDNRRLKPYIAPKLGLPLDANGNKTQADSLEIFWGLQFSDADENPFYFNPPPFIIETVAEPAFETLWDLSKAPYYTDLDGNLRYANWVLERVKSDLDSFKGGIAEAGLRIGQFTEGWGVGQMCPEDPYPGFCQTDFSPAHPLAKKNWPEPNNPDVEKTELRFPPFLRNPAQGIAGAGDIIAPTQTWEPFLFLNPYNGTIFNDPDDKSQGYWVDGTFAHGATIFAGESKDIIIEMPRSSAQLFYQFDDLFHDNAIFSPHPIVDTSLGQ
ncbi:MAG: hypothetical protein AAGD38_13665 [Acidobacteriota bacterium]